MAVASPFEHSPPCGSCLRRKPTEADGSGPGFPPCRVALHPTSVWQRAPFTRGRRAQQQLMKELESRYTLDQDKPEAQRVLLQPVGHARQQGAE